ncbi:MAG: DUF2099 family protein [Candidatus Lokiarchaeota archaeon]|nr:DUF2099 family protein [Candidatus Lokiarchaeota archaeon]
MRWEYPELKGLKHVKMKNVLLLGFMGDNFLKKKIHVWESAKSVIKIDENGKIVSTSEPLVKYCPIRNHLYKVDRITTRDIKKSMEWKIKNLGMCNKNRILTSKIAGVGYGASECFMTALDKKLLDVAVIVCEGAGTIISNNKDVIQGVGFPMNALISTFPIKEIISRLEKLGVIIVDPENASIYQINGVKKAIDLKYKRIGVTIAGPNCEAIETLRNFEEKYKVKILICVVHTTGVKSTDEKYLKRADIVQSCASKIIRIDLENKNKYLSKYGNKIPVYAYTKFGQKILDERNKEMKKNPPSIKIGDKIPNNVPEPLL